MAKAKQYKKKSNYMKKYKPKEITPEAKKFAKEVAKTSKKIGKKSAASVVKKVAGKVIARSLPGAGAALSAIEIAKGAKKVGKSMKAKSDCQKRGGIYKKGFCISSKSIKAKSVKKK
jgi:hypothetical protein